MTPDASRDTAENLQFDRLDPGTPPGDSSDSSIGVSCSRCSTALSEYFHVDGASMCARCKDLALEAAMPNRSWSALARSVLYGAAAAIAGAIVYYGVIAITDLEIGIVAILIGYMVGHMVRKGAAGRGGRRFQVSALLLTYFSVALAYSPIVFKSAMEHAPKVADSTQTISRAVADSTAAVSTVTKPDSASVTGGSVILAFGALLLFILALPVMVVFGSMPSGLISALIIGVGMHQAWRMTGAAKVDVSGPYRVGAEPAPSPA
jgi:hypothetical protein